MPVVSPFLKGLLPAPQAMGYRLHEEDWRPMRLGPAELPGYDWIALPGDGRAAWQAYWMRMAPGTQGPVHAHPSAELVQVFQGDFCEASGPQYGPGDVVIYEAGSRHATYSVGGCIVLVIARSDAVVLDNAD